MHCRTTRELLQDWFDLSGGGPMPADASAHIRECTSCRDYVRTWDRIELGLQALRESAPSPSADFKVRVESSPVRAARKRPRRSAATYARWAAGTATAILAGFAITYAVTGRGPLQSEKAGSLAIVRPAQPNGYVPQPGGLTGDLPLAQTR